MRESRTYGSVRGALSNERPYRVWTFLLRLLRSGYGPGCVKSRTAAMILF